MRAGALNSDPDRAHLEVVRQLATATSTAVTMAHERTLEVDDALRPLVPSGTIRRGSTLSLHGVGATSFALALVAQSVRDGSFLAVLAPNSFGLAACLDFDIPLRRVVQFVLPSGDNWAQSVAAVVEGFDVVLLLESPRVRPSAARQLVARTRERGSVLALVGGPAWPDAADLRFDLGTPDWSGLGAGHGYLRSRQVSVKVAGRRYHGSARPHELLLPDVGGGVSPAPIDLPTPISAAHSEVSRSVSKSVSTGHYAGSDIDALLDVIDAVDEVSDARSDSSQEIA